MTGDKQKLDIYDDLEDDFEESIMRYHRIKNPVRDQCLRITTWQQNNLLD